MKRHGAARYNRAVVWCAPVPGVVGSWLGAVLPRRRDGGAARPGGWRCAAVARGLPEGEGPVGALCTRRRRDGAGRWLVSWAYRGGAGRCRRQRQRTGQRRQRTGATATAADGGNGSRPPLLSSATVRSSGGWRWPGGGCQRRRAAGRQRWAAAVEPRTTSSGAKTNSSLGPVIPAISSSSTLTAASAMAWTGWRIVVSGGSVKAISGLSS